MSEILMRVELHNEDQARDVLTRTAHPWIKDQLRQHRPLVAEFRLLDDDISERQRGYLHAVVLTEIAQGLVLDGKRHSMKTWKEHLRRKFLPDKRVTHTNPLTGRTSHRRVRQSTEDLGIKGMADYIDKCCAFAAEYGVTISEPLPPELRPARRRAKAVESGDVDQETGEILEVAA